MLIFNILYYLCPWKLTGLFESATFASRIVLFDFISGSTIFCTKKHTLTGVLGCVGMILHRRRRLCWHFDKLSDRIRSDTYLHNDSPLRGEINVHYLHDISIFCSNFAALMISPPCELGWLGAEVELFDSMKSSSSIFLVWRVHLMVSVIVALFEWPRVVRCRRLIRLPLGQIRLTVLKIQWLVLWRRWMQRKDQRVGVGILISILLSNF